jgi:hypothetical protein
VVTSAKKKKKKAEDENTEIKMFVAFTAAE